MPDTTARNGTTHDETPAEGAVENTAETIERQRETIRDLLREKYEPVAIVGVGLRFPGGSNTPDEFAEFLAEGRSGIVPFPEDRWDSSLYGRQGDEEEPGRIRAMGAGLLDRIDQFDAAFFNISPKEAQYLDPQQRMLMETSWEALEHANIDPTPLRHGNGGVYVGASSIDFAFELEGVPYRDLDGHLASGTTFFPMSGRLSYFLGWRGPSMSVDSACASGLTALHLAVEGLRRRECDIALAAGVNALHHPRTSVIFSHANMLARDGRCKTFDESADGYARAEGCAVLVLKRLSDAKRDGDRVLALVRGTAVGQDGESAGLTVPNGNAQVAVMRTAIEAALLEPGAIQYVEAHGTGTPLGDPIEMGAIADVFADSHTAFDPVTVGSVKTNLGHMEPVSGLVGVIKTMLQLRSGVIYPHLNFTRPSGRIPWDSYPVTVPTECRPWVGEIRRGLVNSFGFGGTIAAAVLEEAPPTAPPALDQGDEHVFAVSAKNRRALKGVLERYRDHLAAHPDVPVADLCRTAGVGRAHFNLRVAGVVADHAELDALLVKQLARLERGDIAPAETRKVAFLFTGQGSQYPGMGATLYRAYAVFREHVDRLDELFAPLIGRSVRALLLGRADDAEVIHQTRFTQPALFTLEYALAQLWLSFGARPSALIGHSIGEVVAATVAGLFTVEDAVTLVAARGRLMQSVTAPGGMAAVPLPAAEVAPLLEGYPDLAIAAVNSPKQCVISGGDASLTEVCELLSGRGLRVTRLSVSHAFHSPLMTEVFDAFRAELAGIAFHEPKLTLVSNVTGKVARFAEISTPEYWIRHIGEAVDFEAGMRVLERRGRHIFVEIGPSAALIGLAKQCVDPDRHRWIASLNARDAHGATLRKAVTQFYLAGATVSWQGFHSGGAKVTLPTYAFDRKRYWLPVTGTVSSAAPAGHPLLGREVAAEPGSRAFTTRVAGTPAASAYLELILALQDLVYGETTRPILDLRVVPRIAGDEEIELRVRLTHLDDGSAGVEVFLGGDASPVAEAVIGAPDPRGVAEPGPMTLDTVVDVPEGTDLLSAALLDAVWSALDDESWTPVRFGAARLLKKPRGERLRVAARTVATEDELLADVLLYEDDRKVAELTGVTLHRPLEGGGHFLHRLHWVERPAVPADGDRPRHVLVVGRTAGDLGAAVGLPMSFAARAAEAGDILRDQAITDVCWFWTPEEGPPGVDRLRAENERNYRDLLDLLGTLDAHGFGRGQRLWLVTEGAQRLPGDPVGTGAELAASTLWGFGQVLLNERPGYRSTLVDLPPGGYASLGAELAARDTGEFQVAYRDGVRNVKRLRPHEHLETDRAVTIDGGHTYLVTGGLGAIGLLTAHKLADLGARHLVLVGRQGRPAPDAAELYARLGERAEVTVVTGDLGDPGDVRRIFAGLRGGPHPLGGIVHAAGALADAPISAQTWESIDGLFGPKVYGSWLLHEAAADFPDLAFFVAHSSASSVVGGATQSNYAAANAFLDQLCHWRAAQGLPALAVNWGPWSGAGMSARLNEEQARALDREGIKFFTPARALRALVSLLGQPVAQVAGGVCDWDAFLAAKPVTNALYEELGSRREQTGQSLDLDALLAAPRAERLAALRDLVRLRVAKVLHIEDVDDVEYTDEFGYLGLNSLGAVEFKNALEAALRIPLAGSVAFDHPTAARLSEFLDNELVPVKDDER
ncbi:SDR family NAD(P)-dependent oxidoreductase [Microbispora sp. NPDC049125]|uniref:type I polyketide synthase n=1 Tax=Microbispora sp. NPDC049125 TaxID=3154929 RepID=UPI003467DF8A